MVEIGSMYVWDCGATVKGGLLPGWRGAFYAVYSVAENALNTRQVEISKGQLLGQRPGRGEGTWEM